MVQIVKHLKDLVAKGQLISALTQFNAFCGYNLEPQQVWAQMKMIAKRESAGCWGRQLGKTLTCSLTTMFMNVVLGWRVGYRTPMLGQCDAPMEYWQSTPFYSGQSSGWVKFNNKRAIHLSPITNNNMRSKTLDVLIYDEQAGCTKTQEAMLIFGKKMIQNSKHRHLVRISTPIVGTAFEKDFYRLEKQNCATHYTYKSFNQQAAWIQAAIEEIKETELMVEAGHYPRHLFKQETLAQFAPAGGAIFSDYSVEELNISKMAQKFIGIDINPKFGHIAVVCSKLEPNIIYVHDEIELTANTEYAAQRIYNMMKYNVSVNMENNGAGQEAAKFFNKYLMRGYDGSFAFIDWNDQRRISRVMGMLEMKFIFSPRVPKTFDQFKGFAWDEKHKLRPNKTPDDHYIDSLLHACHFANKYMGISHVAVN